MNICDAENFCNAWLPAWTGNDPLKLIGFYAEDAFYLDPTVKNGLNGHGEMLPYFTKLLKNNPAWKWTREEILPTEKGFVLKWKAVIPAGAEVVTEYGLDIVEMRDGTITRNEVYFDTLKLIQSILKKP
ncbi:MAG TPA: nuclear transport factor 2 family protein [Spirochaetota bacterium]|nr:nuclear transport factor 2 family protein [Spirochaetota bacterium]HOD16744.1 nuclear transport factor 2 family protein [Spirochaetota bacterium]HPG50422.1 nuclear transport factor 2 family protein [Spirochaetota bacterium]HPN13607.1 nuclear transport factor 2 family protein [Spirochaetota bacterium]HQL81298.1 nuclear transport factor 2 family protein [Spirochaetota bacterium]